MGCTKKDLRLLDEAKRNIKLIEKRHPFTQHYVEDFYWQFDNFRELLADLVKDKVNGSEAPQSQTKGKSQTNEGDKQ